jgi:hypothetical protein
MSRLGDEMKRAWSAFWSPFSPTPSVEDLVPPTTEVFPYWGEDLTSPDERRAAIQSYININEKFLEAAIEAEAIAREQGMRTRPGEGR